ncbi:MAG: hypothetical protein ACRDS9_19905 [Pseudonocardiaceae bacterium]
MTLSNADTIALAEPDPLAGRRLVMGLPVGTRVRRNGSGREGTVMCYEPRYSCGRFPVRQDSGLWEVCNTSDVIVIAAPT